MHVTHESEVSHLKDGRFRILVDRNDVFGTLHSHHVLGRPRNATRDIDGRFDGLARLTYLIGIRDPPGVDDGAARARCALQNLGKFFDQLEVGRAPPTGEAANDLARTTMIPGPSPVKRARTVWVPPKTGCSVTSPASSTIPVTLVKTGRSRRAERRPAISRPS